MKSEKLLPTLFVSHGGGPCFFMDWEPPGTWDALGNWLRGLGAQVGRRPEAILVVSAHWEAPTFQVTGAPQPPLIYDYQGFPPHTYQIAYPAPGSPALAQTICEHLQAAGLRAGVDPRRGWDHGVFIPLKLMYPQADIPVLQLALQQGLDPEQHLAAGRSLAPLRDRLLIVASGYSYHNMRGYGGAGEAESVVFDQWLNTELTQADAARRAASLRAWEQAPAARHCHPREEHLLPLMVAVGAAGEEAGTRIFSEKVWGVATSGYRFG